MGFDNTVRDICSFGLFLSFWLGRLPHRDRLKMDMFMKVEYLDLTEAFLEHPSSRVGSEQRRDCRQCKMEEREKADNAVAVAKRAADDAATVAKRAAAVEMKRVQDSAARDARTTELRHCWELAAAFRMASQASTNAQSADAKRRSAETLLQIICARLHVGVRVPRANPPGNTIPSLYVMSHDVHKWTACSLMYAISAHKWSFTAWCAQYICNIHTYVTHYNKGI